MFTKVVISGYCALLAGLYAINCLAAEHIDSQKAPSALQWQWSYDDRGDLVELLEPDGKVINISYARDEDGRLQRMTKTLADGISVTVNYDRFERPISMRDQLGTVHYDYDGYYRLTAVRREGRPAIRYAYDTLDRIHAISVGDQFTMRYRYDFLGRLATMETPAGTISYEYYNGQRQMIRILPNGIHTVWEYRPDGNLASITHVASDRRILAQFAYDYRPDGLVHQINERSPHGQRVFTYDYDTMQRLTAVTDSQSGKIDYRYDTVGNRLALLAPGTVPVTSTYDWAGRLISYNGQPCTHDPAGNLTSCTGRPGKATFEYNRAHLLKTVTTEHGAVHYQYDGDNRLIARTVGKDKTVFVVDPLAASWRPWLAIPPNGIQTLYLWEGRTPLAAVTGSEMQFFLHDHLGSVRYLTDRTGRIVQQFDYGPFGESRQGLLGDLLQPRFAGLFLEPRATAYLTRVGTYDPGLGRMLQRTPNQALLLSASGLAQVPAPETLVFDQEVGDVKNAGQLLANIQQWPAQVMHVQALDTGLRLLDWFVLPSFIAFKLVAREAPPVVMAVVGAVEGRVLELRRLWLNALQKMADTEDIVLAYNQPNPILKFGENLSRWAHWTTFSWRVLEQGIEWRAETPESYYLNPAKLLAGLEREVVQEVEERFWKKLFKIVMK